MQELNNLNAHQKRKYHPLNRTNDQLKLIILNTDTSKHTNTHITPSNFSNAIHISVLEMKVKPTTFVHPRGSFFAPKYFIIFFNHISHPLVMDSWLMIVICFVHNINHHQTEDKNKSIQNIDCILFLFYALISIIIRQQPSCLESNVRLLSCNSYVLIGPYVHALLPNGSLFIHILELR